jgi:hypothetical protein
MSITTNHQPSAPITEYEGGRRAENRKGQSRAAKNRREAKMPAVTRLGEQEHLPEQERTTRKNEQYERNKHPKQNKEHKRDEHPNIIVYHSPCSIIIQLEQRDRKQLHVLRDREDLLPRELDEKELLALFWLRDVCGNEWILWNRRVRYVSVGVSLEGRCDEDQRGQHDIST